MMNRRFVVAVVSGAMVGASIGLLVAPRSGRDTRQVVRDKAGRLITSVRQRGGEKIGKRSS